jgi:hypothetical protein
MLIHCLGASPVHPLQYAHFRMKTCRGSRQSPAKEQACLNLQSLKPLLYALVGIILHLHLKGLVFECPWLAFESDLRRSRSQSFKNHTVPLARKLKYLHELHLSFDLFYQEKRKDLQEFSFAFRCKGQQFP